MSKLVWDQTGERKYETGVDRGVLFPIKSGKYQTGVAWNGLTAVNESPSGAEPSAIYADNIKYLNLMSEEEFAATIEAYTYPDEFKEYIGEVEIAVGATIGQQGRKPFGLVYRTLIGNDEDGRNHGYKLHLIFSCMASTAERNNTTITDTPEVVSDSWEISTTPIDVEGFKPTAKITLDSTKFTKAGLSNVLKAIEDVLFGTDTTNAKLPYPYELVNMVNKEMHLLDSKGNMLLDSTGNPIRSNVF